MDALSNYLEGFSLGNAAILTNVCLLPLYPGTVVFLAERFEHAGSPKSVRWAGALVFAGVVSSMVAIGGVLYLLSLTFSDILDWLLPVMYGLVLALGIGMLMDKNPFVRARTAQSPIFASPSLTAFLYGVTLAPMTLPCTGPVVLSAFVVGGVAGTGTLIDNLVYFLFFAMGFGWPLAVLPLLAAPAQRQLTRFFTQHHRAISLISGLMLIGIALFGLWEYAHQ